MAQYSAPWTPEEDALLAELCPMHTHQEISDRTGRTVNAVRNRCALVSSPKFPAWTQAEEQTLLDWYRDHPEGTPLELELLAARLGRHKSNVSRKAKTFGLTNHKRTRVEKINGLFPCEYKRRKFKTREEYIAARSAISREQIARNGHPRGALGMKHSPETLKVLSEKSKAAHARRTPEQKRSMSDKGNQTRIARYGTDVVAPGISTNAYSRGIKTRYPDLDNRFFRSLWEANYARYLNWLKGQGEIQGWEYEAERFIFHGETRGAISYTPDFKVTERDGSIVYHEVKGWMDSKSKTRLKRMKKHYPDESVIVVDEDAYKAIAKWKGMIPGWESAAEARARIAEEQAANTSEE